MRQEPWSSSEVCGVVTKAVGGAAVGLRDSQRRGGLEALLSGQSGLWLDCRFCDCVADAFGRLLPYASLGSLGTGAFGGLGSTALGKSVTAVRLQGVASRLNRLYPGPAPSVLHGHLLMPTVQ